MPGCLSPWYALQRTSLIAFACAQRSRGCAAGYAPVNPASTAGAVNYSAIGGHQVHVPKEPHRFCVVRWSIVRRGNRCRVCLSYGRFWERSGRGPHRSMDGTPASAGTRNARRGYASPLSRSVSSITASKPLKSRSPTALRRPATLMIACVSPSG